MTTHASRGPGGAIRRGKAAPADTRAGGAADTAARVSRAVQRQAAARPRQVSTLLSPRPQPELRVSSPMDAAEREARTIARQVMQAPAPLPGSRPRTATSPGAPGTGVARSIQLARAGNPSTILRAGPATAAPATPAPAPRPAIPAAAPRPASPAAAGEAVAAPEVARELRGVTGGAPLPSETRSFMEPRFRADFSGVRIHTDSRAARLAARLAARAFTFGRHIFFGRDQYRPDSREGAELLAHELTHTIQQGETIQRSEDAAVRMRAPTAVRERAPAQAQRLGTSDALNFFADRANLIPGFRMFTLVLGVNPINMSRVERSAANILRALVEFIPGGGLIVQALDNHGVFDRAGAWIEQQINALGLTGRSIRAAIDEFLDGLTWSDIFDLGGVWNRARRIFTEPIDRILALARSVGGEIIRMIKDAILRPLAELASQTRAWDLLCAVLGRNPITGDAVPRTAETLIGGFMKLIDQEEVWNNLRESGAVPRAWAWFQGTLAGVLAFVRELPDRFVNALRALEIADIVLLPRAFARVGATFAGFVGQFLSWAGGQVLSLLEIIFDVVAPAVMPYVRRAAGAFRTIIRDPIRFVGHLVRAGLQGLRQFAGNFLTHLRTSLIGWLTGAMSGAAIYIPQAFTLPEIIKFVLSVLGLTWANIRQKLVRAIGETAVVVLERGFELIRTLITEGPAAAWQQIMEGISNLREMVMEQVMTFVRERIVEAAITRLVTSLNPAGAVIQAIIATYNTIMFFVERLRQIAQVAAAFIDAIATIAAGNIAPAANRVEQTMAGLLTLVISFLARIAGLGRVSDAVINIINRVRAPIDRALDRVVNWIVTQARRVGRLAAQAGVPQDPNERLRLASQASLAIASRLPRTGLTAPVIARAHDAIKLRYGLSELTPYRQNNAWFVRAVVNPPLVWRLPLPGETAGGGISRVAEQTGPGGVVTAGVVGELRPGIPRQGMESALPSAGSLAGLAGNYLQDYRRAHLYGPGFGDETAIGLMYASEEVNNQLQSTGAKYGIEGYARQIRQYTTRLGGRVGVMVLANSYPDPPPGVPQPLGQPVLKEVSYTFIIIDAAGNEVSLRRGRATATITCAPPRPNGAGGQGRAYVARLNELQDYLGSRSERTGL